MDLRTGEGTAERCVARTRGVALAWLCAAALGVACGGSGGDGSGTTTPPDAGSGPITGFGSVFVGDTEWSLAGAAIRVDGASGVEADLSPGMVVRLRGTIAQGALTATATSVDFDLTVEGPIAAVPTTPSPGVVELSVLGHTIVAEDGVTTFEAGATLGGLAMGDFVRVSGLRDDTGRVIATWLALAPPGSARVELSGTVSGLMRNIGEFMLGPVTVQYQPGFQGTIFRNGLLSPLDLADGKVVDVVDGTWTAPDRIEADVIELEEPVLGVDSARAARLRGFVANLVSWSQFEVAGVPVSAGTATFVPPAFSPVDGDYVQVSGRLSGGTLYAAAVESERLDDLDGDPVEIRAAIGTGGLGAFGASTIGLLGIEVRVDASTIFVDDRDGVSPFGWGDLAEADWLVVRGAPSGNAVLATRIHRDTFPGDVTLQGPVSFVNAMTSSLSILGRPMALAVTPDFRDVDGNVITQGAFFAGVSLGTMVRAVDASAVSAAGFGNADRLSIVNFD